MYRVKHLGIALAAVISVFLVFSQVAYGSVGAGTFEQGAGAYYIGPGTLTIIWQVLLALAIGGAAMIGIYRVRVKNFLTNIFAKQTQKQESGETEETEENI